MRTIGCLLLALAALSFLPSCADKFPVPGGDDKTNESFYGSEEELKHLFPRLHPGMTEREVFTVLRRSKDELVQMDRDEIVSTLYGGNNAAFTGTLQEREYARQFLETLYGYKFHFKIVEREHGFSSPIRLKTREKGYSYTMKMVFWQGHLFDKPVLAGGPVNNTSSETIFDYLNPLSWLGRPF